jgi:hypothetical protein
VEEGGKTEDARLRGGEMLGPDKGFRTRYLNVFVPMPPVFKKERHRKGTRKNAL